MPDTLTLDDLMAGNLQQAPPDTSKEFPDSGQGGHPGSLLKAAIQPLRDVGAKITENILEGGEIQPNEQRIQQAVQAQQQPLPGAATGLAGTLAGLPAQAGMMMLSPGITAASQLTNDQGQITPGTAAQAAATYLLGKGAAQPLTEAAAKLLPFGGNAANAGINAGVGVGVNALSGAPARNGLGLNLALGALGKHGDIEKPLTLDEVTNPNRTQNAASEAPEAQQPKGPITLQDVMAGEAKTAKLKQAFKDLSDKQDQQLAARNDATNVRMGNVKDVPDVFDAIQKQREARAPLPRAAASPQQPAPKPAPVEEPAGPFSTEIKRPAQPETQTISRWQQQMKEPPVNPLSPAMMRRRGMVQLPGGNATPTPPTGGLEAPPANARAWSPDEIRSWAARAGHDISDLPEDAGRKTLLETLKERSGGSGPLPATAPLATPHTEQEIRQQIAKRPGTHLDEVEPKGALATAGEAIKKAVQSVFHPQETAALTRAMGTAEYDQMQMLNHTGDFLKDAQGLSEEDYERFHDSVDKTNRSVIPSMQKHVPLINAINKDLSERFGKLGVDTSGNRLGYMSYNFAKPEGMSESVYRGKVSDAENFLKERGSTSYADAKKAADYVGLKSYPQGEGQIRTWANMYSALAFRDMLKEHIADKAGAVVGKDDPTPRGMAELPDKLANDPAFIDAVSNMGGKDKRIVVSAGMRAAMDNLLANRDAGGVTKQLIGASNKIKFLADTAYAPRAVVAAMSDALSGQGAHGISEGVWAHLGKLDPEQNSVLAYAMKNGLRSEFLPGMQDLERTQSGLAGKLAHGAKTALSAPRLTADAAKISGVMEGTRNVLSDDTLSEAQKQAKVRQIIDVANSKYGMPNKAQTLPPLLTAVKNIVSPTLGYFSSAFKLAGQAATGNKTALTHLLAGAAGVAAGNGLLTWAMTGTAPHGDDWMRFRTGGKNDDGSDRRAGFTSFMQPLITAISSFEHSPTFDDAVGNIANSVVNPTVKAIAQAIINRDFHGNQIGGPVDRAEYIMKAMGPMLPASAKFWEDAQQQRQEAGDLNTAEQVGGMRSAPRWSEESKASNLLADFENARRGPQAGEDDPAAFAKTQWRQQLYQNWDGKTNYLKDPKIADTVKSMTDAIRHGTLSGSDAKALIHEVQQRITSPGLQGIGQAGLPPQEMLQIWGQATPQEQAQMKPSILQKFSKLRASTMTNRQDWLALRKAVTGK